MSDMFGQKRSYMVVQQLQARGIYDPKVLESMRSVPRHLFVPASLINQAYEDSPLPIGYQQTISQPYIVALMLQAAQLKPTDTVLEIGTGCGYAAAVLAKLVTAVYSIEFIPELAAEGKTRLKDLGYSNVSVLQGDGSLGLEQHAPFEAIIVAAGAPIVPTALKNQLVIEGRLIIPQGNQTSQELLRITRLNQNYYQEEKLGAVCFVPLKGEEGWP